MLKIPALGWKLKLKSSVFQVNETLVFNARNFGKVLNQLWARGGSGKET